MIVGLGNFGFYLAKRLTELGHEVVGVDTSELKIEQIKDQMTHAVALNATDPEAVKNLPMKEIGTSSILQRTSLPLFPSKLRSCSRFFSGLGVWTAGVAWGIVM